MHTKKDIIKQLTDLGAPQDRPIIIHSALSLIGQVENGPEGFLDTLIEYFTQNGGLVCIPTHTWHKLGKEGYTLDMTKAESCVGQLSKLAIAHKLGTRTENPTHSMVVFGNKNKVAEFIKEESKVTTPTAPEGCYGKLYSQDGYILLIGVAQNKNTYLHAVGEIMELPDRMSKNPCKVSVLDKNGIVTEKEFWLYETSYTDDISLRFTKYETAFRYHGAIKDGFIGDAPVQLCSARTIFDTVKMIYQNSRGIDPLLTEEAIPPKLYVKKE